MKARTRVLTLIVLSVVAVGSVFACGDENTLADAKECWVVVVQTGVGTRCGQIREYGMFATSEEAEAWAKQHAPKSTEDTYVTERRVELVKH